jgi:hypothetical protein
MGQKRSSLQRRITASVFAVGWTVKYVTTGREQLQQIFTNSTCEQRKEMMDFGAFGGSIDCLPYLPELGHNWRYHGRNKFNYGCGIYRVS